MINEGKPPFSLDPERGSRLGKKKASELNRKYYGETGFVSQLRPSCRICGRKISCNHRSFGAVSEHVPYKPVILGNFVTCTNCNSQVLTDRTICPSCGLDPHKERSKK